MTKCENYQNLMMRYFDHRLDKPDQKKLDQHLDSCADCRLLFSQLSGILTKLENSGPIHTQILEPPDEWERLVLDRVMSMPVQAGKEERSSAKIVYGSIAGIAALLLLFVSLSFQDAGLLSILSTGRNYLESLSGILVNLQVVYQIAASLFSSEIFMLLSEIRFFFFLAVFLSLLVAMKMAIGRSSEEDLINGY